MQAFTISRKDVRDKAYAEAWPKHKRHPRPQQAPLNRNVAVVATYYLNLAYALPYSTSKYGIKDNEI